MASTRLPLCSIVLVALCVVPAAAETQPLVPEAVAREVGKRLASHFDGIQTLQFRFHTTVRYLYRPDDSDHWKDFEYGDAFYAYDATADSHYLNCIDTQYGRNLRKKVVQTPTEARMLYEHQGEGHSPEGFVKRDFSTAWELYGPQVFVSIRLLKQLRANIETDNYRVFYSDGPGSDPVVSVGLGPDPVEEPPQRGFDYRIKLDADRGFTPYEYHGYFNGNRARVVSLELFEAAPGVWLPQRGLAKGWGIEEPDTEFYEAEFRMDTQSVRVNQPMATSVFDLRFPVGTRVNDQVRSTVYTEGLKPGQATQQRVVANAQHARHIAPPTAEQQAETTATPTGTVRADYGTPWYGRVWFWTLTGSVLAVAVAGFLFNARRG